MRRRTKVVGDSASPLATIAAPTDQSASPPRDDRYQGIAAITPRGLPRPVSETLPPAIERIVRELQPDKIILFGSYAYGVPTPDSDVDLLIIMETDASTVQRYLAVSLLLYPRPFPVDILVKTPREVEQALARRDVLVREILSRGRVLYERGH